MSEDDDVIPEVPPEGHNAVWMSIETTRIAIENASIGMAVLDPATGIFLEVNQALCDFLRRDRQTLRGIEWQTRGTQRLVHVPQALCVA